MTDSPIRLYRPRKVKDLLGKDLDPTQRLFVELKNGDIEFRSVAYILATIENIKEDDDTYIVKWSYSATYLDDGDVV